MNPPRKLHIKSYGCQMNVYDAQRMVDTLAPEGFVETASVDDADLVILNTCHIREKASEKVYSELGRLRVVEGRSRAQRPRDEHRGRRLRRAGRRRRDHPPRAGGRCRGRPAELSSSAASAGAGQEPRPRDRDRIPGRGQIRHSCRRRSREAIRARGISSFVTVQEGCDKFCTFCVVPYTRGAEVSRPVAKIVDDVRAPRRQRRARDHADRPERQRLSRRGTGRRAPGRSARCCIGLPKSPASCGCATRPAIRATSTTA